MNLDKIQEMWQKDSVIDPDNLHDESLKIPQLHSKYYTLYNTITRLREKARASYLCFLIFHSDFWEEFF